MAIFNSYVKLPEGIRIYELIINHYQQLNKSTTSPTHLCPRDWWLADAPGGGHADVSGVVVVSHCFKQDEIVNATKTLDRGDTPNFSENVWTQARSPNNNLPFVGIQANYASDPWSVTTATPAHHRSTNSFKQELIHQVQPRHSFVLKKATKPSWASWALWM